MDWPENRSAGWAGWERGWRESRAGGDLERAVSHLAYSDVLYLQSAHTTTPTTPPRVGLVGCLPALHPMTVPRTLATLALERYKDGLDSPRLSPLLFLSTLLLLSQVYCPTTATTTNKPLQPTYPITMSPCNCNCCGGNCNACSCTNCSVCIPFFVACVQALMAPALNYPSMFLASPDPGVRTLME
jgi:hypothetical protein